MSADEDSDSGNSEAIRVNFGDVQLFGNIMQYKGLRDKTYWERIGEGGTITANPTVYDNTIYFGAYDRNFYALDMEGNEKWRFATNGVIQAHALCRDGRVYFGSGDSNFYCLDAETGELVWKFSTNGPISNGTSEHKGIIYISSTDGGLYALKESDGSLAWVFRTSYPISTPLIKDDKIYAGYESSCLYCLNLKGELLWKFNAKAWIAAWPPAEDKDTIYFGSADKNLYAITADGKLKWRYAAKDIVLCPVFDEGRIYFGCADDKAYCLDSKGRKIWEFGADSAVSEITVEGDTAYMGSYDNCMYAVDKHSGKLIWKFATNGFIHCKPYVFENKVMFGSWDCNFYCLDKKTGRLLWKFKTSMSKPSSIEPPEQIGVKRIVFRPSEEPENKEEKYKAGPEIANYETDLTVYAGGMSKAYLSSRKRGYVRITE